MPKVNVYAHNDNGYCYNDRRIVARVNYNSRLDYWNGHNHQNGGTGMHKGITKLKKPIDPNRPYVIIIGSQWQGSKDYGYLVTPEEAAREVLESNSQEESWMWEDLKELCESLDSEEE